MGRLKAVFLDLGGTLIDPASDKSSHLRVLEATRSRYNLDISVQEFHKRFVEHLKRHEPSQAVRWTPVLGLTLEVFQREMEKVGIYVDNRDNDWFLKTYMATFRKGIKLSAGATEILRGVKQLGLHVGIISDVDDTWASSILENLRIRPLLDSITTSESVGVAKPNPKIFNVALRKAKCEPTEAIHAGDSLEKDVRGAKGVGMMAVHVSSVAFTDADYTVKSLNELLPIVRNLAGARP